MKILTCKTHGSSIRGIHKSRFVFMGKEGMGESADISKDVPEGERITKEHIEQVLRAVDSNIKTIEDYYNDRMVKQIRGIKMPKEVKDQVAKLKLLRDQLEMAKANPAGARKVLSDIYKIFSTLDTHAKKHTAAEGRSGDPLATFGYSISRPKLEPGMTDVEKRNAEKQARESKEKQQTSLFNSAVRILVAGGEITQDELDAVKGQFRRENTNVLARTLSLERGQKIDVYIALSPDGKAVNAKGVMQYPQQKGQRPSGALVARFDVYQSLDADDKKPVQFTAPSLSQMVARAKAQRKTPQEIV